MANNRSGRPPFKPTIATVTQVEALEAQLNDLTSKLSAVLTRLDNRLSLAEHALNQVVQDIYYGPEEATDDGVDRGEPHEDDRQGPPEAEEDFVPGDGPNSAEERREHDQMPTAMPPSADEDADREAAMRAWEDDGGPIDE